MKRTVFGGVALLGIGLILAGCADRKADETAIREGERLWGGAYVTGDVNAVTTLLADDFIGIKTSGGRYTKAEAVDDVRRGPINTTSDVLGPVTVRFFGDTAIAQGSETGTEGAPEKRPFASVWTSVWVKRGGQWRVVASQDVTPMDATPGVLGS